MRIRSVTAFVDVTYPLEAGALAEAGEALRAVCQMLEAEGYEVQTVRAATQPFPTVLAEEGGPGKAVDLAKDLEALAFVHEIDYLSLGPVRLNDAVAYVEAIPDVLAGTERVFASIEIANREEGINLSRLRRAADTVRRVAVLGMNGFANLRLAALANVQPWSPFFPAAYHQGGPARVAIATESADLAVAAASGSATLDQARRKLVQAIETEASRIQSLTQQALGPFGLTFQGIDFSLAPYPEEMRSIGAALEQLGLSTAGGQGSLLAAAFLTDALERARFTRTGFCGLMLPVLEDSILAQRAAEGQVSIADLLICSAVCGTGLDTIPLPGDVDEEALAAILADVAALALRLDKPLTARLMPLPGKRAGDEVHFDFEYFAPSRVIAPRGGLSGGLLAGDEVISLQPIDRRKK